MFDIAVDAMGGDFAPDVPVQGTLRALEEYSDVRVQLVGQKERLTALLPLASPQRSRLSLVDAREVITNEESPVMAIRKKIDSSLSRALALVREKKAQALVSAGSTGAVMAGSMFRLDRIPGIDRPAITLLLPTTEGKPVVLLDAGANVDCTPDMLEQFAVMGAVYAKALLGQQDPRVGLVSIGEEAEKGNQQTKAAHQLMARPGRPYTFVGNVEARGVPLGAVDVAVCDGFTGNVLMKAMEGMSKALFTMIQRELHSTLRAKLGGVLATPALRSLRKAFSAEEIGGALMLGASSVVVKAHGNSQAYAFFAAIRQARTLLENDVVGRIARALPASAAHA